MLYRFKLLFVFAFLLGSCVHVNSRLPLISIHDLKPSMPADFYKSRLPATAGNLIANGYLGINLPYEAFAALTKHIEKVEKTTLQTRGEAHITVITPPEMKILNKNLSPTEIQRLADGWDLQKTPFRALCVGRGQRDLDKTYFVVLVSEKIFQFRGEIQKLFEKKGGEKESFNAEDYHPHVTLGFTNKDLHIQDGVIKDERSCFYLFDKETENLLSRTH
jgi:hypothetical protein